MSDKLPPNYVSDTEIDDRKTICTAGASLEHAESSSFVRSYIATSAFVYKSGAQGHNKFELHSQATDGNKNDLYKESMSAGDLEDWIGAADFKRLLESWASAGNQGRARISVSPQIDSDGNDLRVFQVSNRELQYVSYYPDFKVWAGRWVETLPDNSKKHAIEYDIADSWMFSQSDREYPPWEAKWLESTKEKCQMHFDCHGRYLFRPVPIAHAHPTASRVQNSQLPMGPPNRYMQGKMGICAYASLSSALHHVGCTKLGADLFKFSKEWYHCGEMMTQLNQGKLSAYMDPLRRHSSLKRISSIFDRKKADQEQLRALSDELASDMVCDMGGANVIYWVVLENRNGARNHAVAVVGGWVFDSNIEHAVPSTRAGLDLICEIGGGYNRVCQCMIFTRTDRRRNNKRNKDSIASGRPSDQVRATPLKKKSVGS